MTDFSRENDQYITVLELRNYLLKPDSADAFSNYFNTHFVRPMNELGGYTLGQFKPDGSNDRFVWMRGFTDMHTRLKCLNDFYVKSAVWKEFGPGANDMILNSDNVYLLRPLNNQQAAREPAESINSNIFETDTGVTIVDFYICNSTLDKVINLFNSSYLPFLTTLDIHSVTLWISEMSENKFPQLPAFQDKNLLLTLTTYADENEYRLNQERIDSMPESLKKSMLELITIHSHLVLKPINKPLVL